MIAIRVVFNLINGTALPRRDNTCRVEGSGYLQAKRQSKGDVGPDRGATFLQMGEERDSLICVTLFAPAVDENRAGQAVPQSPRIPVPQSPSFNN